MTHLRFERWAVKRKKFTFCNRLDDRMVSSVPSDEKVEHRPHSCTSMNCFEVCTGELVAVSKLKITLSILFMLDLIHEVILGNFAAASRITKGNIFVVLQRNEYGLPDSITRPPTLHTTAHAEYPATST